ncbi:MAG: hypothetical protein J6K42_07010 [Clostridia bacterium]|nr:hypothetical protein [Clostridia bacterium]
MKKKRSVAVRMGRYLGRTINKKEVKHVLRLGKSKSLSVYNVCINEGSNYKYVFYCPQFDALYGKNVAFKEIILTKKTFCIYQKGEYTKVGSNLIVW